MTKLVINKNNYIELYKDGTGTIYGNVAHKFYYNLRDLAYTIMKQHNINQSIENEYYYTWYALNFILRIVNKLNNNC